MARRPPPTPPHRYTLATRTAARAAGPHRPGVNARFRAALAAHGLQLAAVIAPGDYPDHQLPLPAPMACPGDADGWPLLSFITWTVT